MKATKHKYDEQAVEVAEDSLHGIRLKPSMYIGPTDKSGLFHLFKETSDNCVDEFSAGRNKKILIILDKEEVTVVDEGAGIPVGQVTTKGKKKKGKNISVLEAVFTIIHAGGKMTKGSAYGNASGTIGTHGVGIKAVNALSSRFEAYTFRNGSWHSIIFEKGKMVSPVKKCEKPKLKFKLKAKDVGTIIRFIPDKEIFKNAKLSVPQVKQWAQLSAYINGGLEITLCDNGTLKTWKYKDGLKAYLTKLVKKLEAQPLSKKLLIFNGKHIDLAIQFTDTQGMYISAYTNSTFNKDGGKHITTAEACLTEAISKYAKKKQKFGKAEVLDGAVGILNFKIDSPQFSSQTKEKLVDVRAPELIKAELDKELASFFKKNKKLAKLLCQRATQLKMLKSEQAKVMEGMRKLNAKKIKKGQLPVKAAIAPSCNPNKREIFVVEGDSAAGSAKQARDKHFQEVLPLRGKVLNSMKAKDSEVFKNQQVLDILLMLGFNPKLKDPLSKLRVLPPDGKLILLADPDVDGFHITLLLLALISKYLPQLFDMGLVYLAMPPEFMIKHKGKYYFSRTRKGLQKLVPSANTKDVMHIKGLGEMNPKQLMEVGMDPKTRYVYKIDKPDKAQMKEFTKIMSEDTSYRKELLGI